MATVLPYLSVSVTSRETVCPATRLAVNRFALVPKAWPLSGAVDIMELDPDLAIIHQHGDGVAVAYAYDLAGELICVGDQGTG